MTTERWETLAKPALAVTVGKELVVGAGSGIAENRSIARLVRDGHAAAVQPPRALGGVVSPEVEI